MNNHRFIRAICCPGFLNRHNLDQIWHDKSKLIHLSNNRKLGTWVKPTISSLSTYLTMLAMSCLEFWLAHSISVITSHTCAVWPSTKTDWIGCFVKIITTSSGCVNLKQFKVKWNEISYTCSTSMAIYYLIQMHTGPQGIIILLLIKLKSTSMFRLL